MAGVSIRPVGLNELSALAKLGRQTFYETFSSGNDPHHLSKYLDAAFSEHQLRQEIEDVNSSFYFAEHGGDVVGYLKLNVGEAQTEDVGGSTLEIERIYVEARMQGKGVGKALFDFSLSVANQIEANAVWLGVWEDNLNAIEFYARQGFVPFGEHEFKIGEVNQRDILMRLNLTKVA